MKPPILFVIDDDTQVLRAIERDLRSKYRKDYRVLSASSGEEALTTLQELKLRNDIVALFLSDQRMPGMLGVDFLQKAKTRNMSYSEINRIERQYNSEINTTWYETLRVAGAHGAVIPPDAY